MMSHRVSRRTVVSSILMLGLGAATLAACAQQPEPAADGDRAVVTASTQVERSTVPPGSAGPGRQPDPRSSEPGWASLDQEFRDMFPGLSDAEIAQRRDANDRIKMVGERLAGLPGFAGVMVDWATGKVVVAATSQDTLEVMVKAVEAVGVDVEPRVVRFDAKELERQGQMAWERGMKIPGVSVLYQLLENRVLVTLPAAQMGQASVFDGLSAVVVTEGPPARPTSRHAASPRTRRIRSVAGLLHGPGTYPPQSVSVTSRAFRRLPPAAPGPTGEP